MTPFPAGSKESLFSCTLTASEEAMAVLEEVVLYAFQQCVYYLSKVCAATMLLTVAFPGPWDRREGTASFNREEATTGSTLALAVPLSPALPHTRSTTTVQPCSHQSWHLLQHY